MDYCYRDWDDMKLVTRRARSLWGAEAGGLQALGLELEPCRGKGDFGSCSGAATQCAG
jgi:hypothetical protein